MKTKSLIVAILLLAGCVEEVPFLERNWVKVLGEETNSFGERIIKLDNGDLMIFGELGIAAHDIVNPGDATEIGEIEDQGPAIFITDPNGNLKESHSWPFDNIETTYVDFLNFENATRFIDGAQSPNGGWTMLAETRNIDGIFQGDTLRSSSDAQFVTYFLFSLSSDFEIREIKPLNFGEDWDFRLRVRMSMKALSPTELVLFTAWNFDLSQPIGTLPEGYDYYLVDHDLNLKSNYPFLSPGSNKVGNNFIINSDQELVISGQVSNSNGNFQTLFHTAIGSATDISTLLDDRGTGSPINNNEHFPIQLADGRYAATYTNAPGEIKVSVLSGAFVRERTFRVGPFEKWEDPNTRTGPNRSPRAFIPLHNGDMLLLAVYQPSTEPFAILTDLYRLSPDGEEVFHKRFEGTPGDIIETLDGHIILMTNSPYNEPFEKITIRKLSPNGEIF